MTRRPTIVLPLIAILAMALALPVLAGAPTTPPGQAKEKTPKNPITISGTVESSTDADGEVAYTLRDGGTTYTLDAGPSWFFGDNHPLKGHVGNNVTIEGEVAEGSTEVEVLSVNGTALREPGKPPWAGGWKRVGEAHPGWSQEKADRFEAKFGDCWPPGHCKDKPKGGPGDDPADAPAN